MNKSPTETIVTAIVSVPALIVSAAIIAHIVNCLANDRFWYMIASILCFPVGIFHGLTLIFGTP